MSHITDPEIFKKYPETLTFDEFDSINWDFTKQFGLDDDRPNYEILRTIQRFLDKNNKEKNLVLYTQIDGDSGDRIYSKGNHIVNRTGLWEVVRSKEIERTI